MNNPNPNQQNPRLVQVPSDRALDHPSEHWSPWKAYCDCLESYQPRYGVRHHFLVLGPGNPNWYARMLLMQSFGKPGQTSERAWPNGLSYFSSTFARGSRDLQGQMVSLSNGKFNNFTVANPSSRIFKTSQSLSHQNSDALFSWRRTFTLSPTFKPDAGSNVPGVQKK